MIFCILSLRVFVVRHGYYASLQHELLNLLILKYFFEKVSWILLMKIYDWRAYQEEVAAFFRSQGCIVDIEITVQGARAKHDIDVYVRFYRNSLECKWVIECKYWKDRKIPKSAVATLLTIVRDIGADKGIIFTETGYQPGATDIADNTNISLITSLQDFKETALIQCN